MSGRTKAPKLTRSVLGCWLHAVHLLLRSMKPTPDADGSWGRQTYAALGVSLCSKWFVFNSHLVICPTIPVESSLLRSVLLSQLDATNIYLLLRAWSDPELTAQLPQHPLQHTCASESSPWSWSWSFSLLSTCSFSLRRPSSSPSSTATRDTSTSSDLFCVCSSLMRRELTSVRFFSVSKVSREELICEMVSGYGEETGGERGGEDQSG